MYVCVCVCVCVCMCVCVYVCVCEGGGVVGVIPFCAIENEGLHKILQPFLKGHVLFAFQFPHYEKRNNKGGIINTSNIVFLSK